jgi:hypothetical protein
MKKALRLTYELEAIEGATMAAWLLAEALRTEQFGEESHLELAPKALAGVLALISARLHLLRSALVGDRPPMDIWAPHNAADEGEDEPGKDLLVVEE